MIGLWDYQRARRPHTQVVRMKQSALAYIAYGIVKLINFIDRLLYMISGSRLQHFDLNHFVRSLSPEERKELDDPDIREPILLNLRGFHKATNLNAFCRFGQLRQMKSHLTARVGHKAAIQANPSILKTPIKHPVFIIGLPRTGTSLLFNLLSLDPRFRSPMMWEMMNPLPPGPLTDWQTDPRYTKVCRDIELHKFLGDYEFDHVHYMRPHMPEECYFMLQRSFYIYHTILRLPACNGLFDWFFSRDAAFKARLYKFYKEQLQVLGYGHGMEKRHFLLKSHIHLLNIEALLDTFPDACLIFTYRKLRDVIPSFCSMIEAATGYYGPVDEGFGKRCMHMISELSNKGAESFRKLINGKKHSKNLMLIEYDDLVKDTAGTLEGIYDHFGFERDPGLGDTVRNYLHENPRGKHGKHVYTMDDYGLTLDDVKTSCKEYIDLMGQYTDKVV